MFLIIVFSFLFAFQGEDLVIAPKLSKKRIEELCRQVGSDEETAPRTPEAINFSQLL